MSGRWESELEAARQLRQAELESEYDAAALLLRQASESQMANPSDALLEAARLVRQAPNRRYLTEGQAMSAAMDSNRAKQLASPEELDREREERSDDDPDWLPVARIHYGYASAIIAVTLIATLVVQWKVTWPRIACTDEWLRGPFYPPASTPGVGCSGHWWSSLAQGAIDFGVALVGGLVLGFVLAAIVQSIESWLSDKPWFNRYVINRRFGAAASAAKRFYDDNPPRNLY